jgi:hypothetical protein
VAGSNRPIVTIEIVGVKKRDYRGTMKMDLESTSIDHDVDD